MSIHRVNVNFRNCDHWHWSLNGGADSMVMTGNSAEITVPSGDNTITVKGVDANHVVLATDSMAISGESPLSGVAGGILGATTGGCGNTNSTHVYPIAGPHDNMHVNNAYFSSVTKVRGKFTISGEPGYHWDDGQGGSGSVTWRTQDGTHGPAIPQTIKFNNTNVGFTYAQLFDAVPRQASYNNPFNSSAVPDTINGQSNSLEVDVTSSKNGQGVQLAGLGLEIWCGKTTEYDVDTSDTEIATISPRFVLTHMNGTFPAPTTGTQSVDIAKIHSQPPLPSNVAVTDIPALFSGSTHKIKFHIAYQRQTYGGSWVSANKPGDMPNPSGSIKINGTPISQSVATIASGGSSEYEVEGDYTWLGKAAPYYGTKYTMNTTNVTFPTPAEKTFQFQDYDDCGGDCDNWFTVTEKYRSIVSYTITGLGWKSGGYGA